MNLTAFTPVAISASKSSAWPSVAPPTLSWKAPPIQDFVFSRNCTAAALWTAAEQVPFLGTVEYIRQSLPSNMNISAASLTDYQIIEWFTSNVVYGNQTIYNAMRSSAIQNCRYQVCAALEWEGIADLAGVGMVITYFLYAVITTFLFCVMMLDHFYFTGQPHYRSNFLSPYLGLLPKFKPRIYYRLFTATYLCIDAFLATSTVFALSLLAASIFQNAYNILTAGVYATVYATLLSVLLPIFSIFPIAIIQVTSSFTSGFTSLSRNRKMRTESSGRGGTERGRKRETLRRPKLRKAIWILLGLLVTVVVILSFINLDLLNRSRSRTRTLSSTSPAAASATGEGREEKGEGEFYTWLSPQQEFEQWCAPREKESSIRFAILLSILIFAMGVIVWFILIFLRDFPILGIGIGITPLFSPASAPGRFFHFLKVVKRYWWSIVALVNMAGMWVFLTLFTQYRRLIVERAGTSQQDSRWSIGQVLALATWAPWVVDFLYLLVFGPKEGLEGRVFEKWDTVASEDDAMENHSHETLLMGASG